MIASDIPHGSIFLLPWIKRRIAENRNVIAIFSGDTGSGKSYGAIRLAEVIDPTFNLDRVVFTVEDFVSLINADLPRGQQLYLMTPV
jgi:type II secretory ATPase GspE/PulE/Tfp pilus assembly ATPase PilB-like protein